MIPRFGARPEKLLSSGVLLLTAAACCLAMFWAETCLAPPYALRSLIKACLFLGVPVGCSLLGGRWDLKSLFALPSPRALLGPLALGVGVFVLILGAWAVLSPLIRPQAIADALREAAGVTGGNFVWVALYISLANSLLEEFFFRGFLFLGLRRTGMPLAAAHLLSAGAFALYHVAMLTGWFSPLLFGLALAGLFAGGLLFNFLDQNSGRIYPSWLTHMFANFAINAIGFVVLGVV